MRRPKALMTLLLITLASLAELPARGQVIPDRTLGNESTSVVSDVEVRGDTADLIRGGAVRGSNLFHSFEDFNVSEFERVYFTNPTGIGSILSRVTGDRTSNILGTLGVDGPADLFLLNPNGILFGPRSSLDVEGSFYATTADAIDIGNSAFSAIAPAAS